MAEDQPDIKTIVDAAVKEAVAQSLAEMGKTMSRQERRNKERVVRRERFAAERADRIKKRAEARQERAQAKEDAIEKKGAENRKAENQNLSPMPPAKVPEKEQKQQIEKKVTDMQATLGSFPAPPPDSFDPREFLNSAAARASSVNHPWRVTTNGTTVVDGSPEVVAKYKVVGGTVYGQGGSIVVADQEIIGKRLGGFVYLEISRDSSSRELTGGEVKFGLSIPADSYSAQYRPLAQVFGVGGGPPLQLQFEEIRVWELLLVENGEFNFHVFDTNNRTSYPPP